MIQAHNRKIIEIFANAAVQAGDFAKKFRLNNDLQVSIKNDDSPVTFADLEAHRLICNVLQQYLPNIPIISEELTDHNLSAKDRFILIDPIDGTKSYIQGTKDYTINIALIENRRPIAGIIYVPEDNELFYACDHEGSFMCHPKNITHAQSLRVHTATPDDMTMTISALSRQNIQKASTYLHYPIKDIKFVGSAKKFTLIARGTADFYPRLGPTGEWDTASGDILVHEAGGFVHDASQQPITYGKSLFLNGGFIASSSSHILDKQIFSFL